ncbi:MAG: Na+:solute symporter [Gemmatimonadales bacterium]|nr:MAG: Na+:solute symporter [Gemmatimonadales bacterium]
MQLAALDWWIVGLYFLVVLAIGVAVARKAGRNPEQFFLSGRNMPWWLLGISMVATTFSTDTPNLVTDIVRQDGVSGNWVWWAFLLTGMLTVFVYAKLWRRAGVMTDLEFYEIRYGGWPAAFLRGFRAIYLGVFFNVMIMATVTLAAIKISGVLLGIGPVETVLLAGGITVLFSTLGGFRGVVLTDLLLFVTAMGGSIAAAVVAIRHPEVGGLTQLFAHPEVSERLSIFPDMTNMETLIPLLVIPLAVQWWAVWYPGAEPGGGGYVAQRMLAARNESEATQATLLFNLAHYALRPWPWILVGLASLVVFPTIDSLQEAFPGVALSVLGHDMAYAAMLTFLPVGLLGLVTASLAAAYMSTISTHLNWGSSYVVHDFWSRFVEPDLSRRGLVDPDRVDRRLVTIGRISTVLLMVLAGLLALWMEHALQAFQILLQIGAGTGLLFILRWFWWRINAWSELTAMVVSLLAAIYLELVHPGLFPELPLLAWQKIVIGVSVTTVAWITVTYLTRPVDPQVLRDFVRIARPGGPGWRGLVEEARREGHPIAGADEEWNVPQGILAMLAGSVLVYAVLFGTGMFLYGEVISGLVATAVATAAGILLIRLWPSVKGDSLEGWD